MWFIGKSHLDFKQYQFDGVKWAIENELSEEVLSSHNKIKGGFIADEMGLGKTITMLGIIFANYHKKTLIVLPNALLLQWASEIFRLTGYKPIIYHGPNKQKVGLTDLENAHIVLTSYSTLAISKKRQTCLLHQINWYRCVFDEAHHLRNANSRYLGARKLQTNIHWLISGTPVQNKQKDFYVLCSVLGLPVSYYKYKEYRAELFSKYVLHRTKLQVGIIIPNLEITNTFVDWKSNEERIISTYIHEKLKDSEEKFKNIQKAQKMCILPSLLQIPIMNTITTSKMDCVIDTIVSRKGNGAGKLVFCHFYAEIDMIITKLKEGGMTNIANYDGRIKIGKGKNNRLLEKYEVLVIQIQTGCEGLNMQTNYSEVYFVSPNWNPAVESQAIARCHRIGQCKPVYVFKFIMNNLDNIDNNSMDNYMIKVQDKKQLVIKDILS